MLRSQMVLESHVTGETSAAALTAVPFLCWYSRHIDPSLAEPIYELAYHFLDGSVLWIVPSAAGCRRQHVQAYLAEGPIAGVYMPAVHAQGPGDHDAPPNGRGELTYFGFSEGPDYLNDLAR